SSSATAPPASTYTPNTQTTAGASAPACSATWTRPTPAGRSSPGRGWGHRRQPDGAADHDSRGTRMALTKPALANVNPGEPVTAQGWKEVVDALADLYR